MRKSDKYLHIRIRCKVWQFNDLQIFVSYLAVLVVHYMYIYASLSTIDRWPIMITGDGNFFVQLIFI